MSRLALFLLGPPRIERDGEPVQISRRKVVALLAYLAVTGTLHSRDALATLLWPERSQSRARAYLRRALSELNRTLGEGVLTIDRETAGLEPTADPSSTSLNLRDAVQTGSGSAIWLDATLFRELLAEGETHSHPTTDVCSDCATLLEEAVELYSDDFMAGFTLRDSPEFDEWQFFEREALRDELAGTLELLVRWHDSQGAYDRAITCARRWLAMDPLHEPVHRHLMELYAQVGQRSAALRQYQECERILQEELGISPGQGTITLYEQIRTRSEGGDVPLAVVEQPAVARRPRHNLPVQTTPFIGRETELAEIAVLLQDPDCRLLTLIGPGGSGKTRLALEAAASQLEANAYADGVFFVSLARLQSAEGIVPAVADALSFRFHEGGMLEGQLVDYLRQKKLLLILDNYEHLLGAQPAAYPKGEEVICIGAATSEDSRFDRSGGDGGGETLTSQIFRAAPGVKILATSRARLNLGGEQRFHVRGMEVPSSSVGSLADTAEYSAVKLFLQGARRADPDFALADQNASDVVEICRLVQGTPLAIRLAAAWVDALQPAQIAAELSGQIGQGLDLLETERGDVPERQRSMRAAFDYSWRLLGAGERAALHALSVFRGSFSWRAAQQVSGASLRELRALLDKSLLQPVRAPSAELRAGPSIPIGAGRRYEMHELLRQYAAERLEQTPGAAEEARDRHCSHYCSALARRASEIKGPRSHLALAEMDGEMENVRAAWNWAVERRDLAHLGQAIEGLGLYYEERWREREGQLAFQLAAEGLAPGITAEVATAQAQGVQLPPDDPAEATWVLARLMGRVCWFSRSWAKTDHVRALRRQSLALLRRAEVAGYDVRQERARLLLDEGDYDGSLALTREVGDPWWTASILQDAAEESFTRGIDYDQFKREVDESLALFRQAGDRRRMAWLLTLTGWGRHLRGELADAKSQWEQSLPMHRAIDDRWGEASALHALGYAEFVSGNYDRADELLGEARAMQEALGDRRGMAHTLTWIAYTALCRGRLEEAEHVARENVAEGRAVNHAQTLYMGCWILGYVLIAQGRAAEAGTVLEEGLAFSSAGGGIGDKDGLGRVHLHQGRYEQARVIGKEALDRSRDGRRKGYTALLLHLLGDVALAGGAHLKAHGLLEESVALFQAMGYRPELDAARASLAAATRSLGERDQARAQIRCALEYCVETRGAYGLLRVLPVAALLLADAGQMERAVEMYALATRLPLISNSRWYEDVVGKHIAAAAESLPTDVVAAAQERGRARDLWAAAQELLDELDA